MKLITLLILSHIIVLINLNAYTLFSHDFNGKIPKKLYTTHTVIEKDKLLPLQTFIFGVQNSEIVILNKKSTPKRSESLKLEGIPFNESSKNIKAKALNIQKKLEKDIYTKNIFPQGVLPNFINYIPDNFKILRDNVNKIKVENGAFIFSKGEWNIFSKISSPLLINGINKDYYIVIKYESKGIHPLTPPIRPNKQSVPLLKYRNNNEWGTQIDIWRVNSKLVDVELTNRRVEEEYRIKNLKVYVIQ